MSYPIKIFESFAGIGAVSKSLSNLNIPYELVGFSEIDKHAIKSFCAIHDVDAVLNFGDICSIDETKLPDFDLYSFGFPCQDFSVVGQQKGAVWKCNACSSEYNPLDIKWQDREFCPYCKEKDILKTKSSLVVESLKIIRHKKPKYLLMENVNALVKKHKKSFNKIIDELQEYGYTTYWSVLDAIDYGVPQKRKRVFVVSIRNDLNIQYQFPEGFELKTKLKDILDESVSEKYYLKDHFKRYLIETSLKNEEKHRGFRFKVHIKEFANLACTITTRAGGRMIDNFIIDENIGDGSDMFEFSKKNLPIVNDCLLMLDKIHIRKLTPCECFVLMGFDKKDFDKCRDIGISDTQLFHQAGNSIVVNVLECVLEKLLVP